MKQIDGKFSMVVLNGDGEPFIVKTATGVPLPPDEPLIIFRARDNLALEILRDYKNACVLSGCTDYQINGIKAQIERFEKWQKENSDKLKQPGITRGQ